MLKKGPKKVRAFSIIDIKGERGGGKENLVALLENVRRKKVFAKGGSQEGW